MAIDLNIEFSSRSIIWTASCSVNALFRVVDNHLTRSFKDRKLRALLKASKIEAYEGTLFDDQQKLGDDCYIPR